MRGPVEDTNSCVYRVQLDTLILEAEVNVDDGGQLTPSMTCRVRVHLNGKPGLETELSRGQLLTFRNFFEAICIQVGGLGKRTAFSEAANR